MIKTTVFINYDSLLKHTRISDFASSVYILKEGMTPPLLRLHWFAQLIIFSKFMSLPAHVQCFGIEPRNSTRSTLLDRHTYRGLVQAGISFPSESISDPMIWSIVVHQLAIFTKRKAIIIIIIILDKKLCSQVQV